MGELPRRDEPCQRCGWKYVGFHVCFDASKPCPGEGVVSATKRVKRKSNPDSSKSLRPKGRYWNHEENKERNKLIVALYKEGLGLKEIGKRYDISHQAVLKVINKFEAATGEKVMRPRGVNNRWSRQEVAGGFN